MQTKITFKSSRNPSDRSIRHAELVHGWKEFNRKRKANAKYYRLDCEDLTFSEYLSHHSIYYDEYVAEPVDKLDYYMSQSKYHNNVRIKTEQNIPQPSTRSNK